MEQPDSIAIVSGGLDSITLVYHMRAEGYNPHLLSFNYGQRHVKELAFAKTHAQLLDLQHDVVDLTGLTHLISNSALTSQPDYSYSDDNLLGGGDRKIEVPEGHYAEDTMKATVVPNRNMIMLSIAAGIAVNNQYKTVGTAVHSGDHFIYPDCRPRFIFSLGQAILEGNQGFHNFFTQPLDANDPHEAAAIGLGYQYTARPLHTPFIDQTKADIAYRALELGVPLHLTWSCYKGGEMHCGRCGTCVERLEAIDIAVKKYNSTNDHTRLVDAEDSTSYEDDEYWKDAIAQELA